MFSIIDEQKEISYEFVDVQHRKWNIALQAEIERTQIEEKEMYLINGYMRTGRSKTEEKMVDTSCMYLRTKVNDKVYTLGHIYDFQKRIRIPLKEKKVRILQSA